MNQYFRFAKNYKKAFLLAPLLVIVDVFCEIVQPVLMSKILDTGISHKDIDIPCIIQVGVLMVGLSLLAIAANVGNIWYSSQGSVKLVTELRKGLLSKIQEFSFANIDRFNSASLANRLTNDVNVLQQVVMMALRLLIRGPLMLIFAVVITVRTAPGLRLIIAISIPVLSICIFFLLRKGIPYLIRLIQGYASILEADGNNLSQEQRQLLNIARAAVAAPIILILDEATSSIDIHTEMAIQEGMDQLMKGRTSFVIAHRLSTVRNADEILVLEEGEIIERRSHSALLQNKGR